MKMQYIFQFPDSQEMFGKAKHWSPVCVSFICVTIQKLASWGMGLLGPTGWSPMFRCQEMCTWWLSFKHRNNMDETGGHYAEWNKPGKDKRCMVSLVCGI